MAFKTSDERSPFSDFKRNLESKFAQYFLIERSTGQNRLIFTLTSNIRVHFLQSVMILGVESVTFQIDQHFLCWFFARCSDNEDSWCSANFVFANTQLNPKTCRLLNTQNSRKHIITLDVQINVQNHTKWSTTEHFISIYPPAPLSPLYRVFCSFMLPV